MNRTLVLLLAVALAGCAARGRAPVSDRVHEAAPPAPVAEAVPPSPEPPVEKPLPTHTVKRGETLANIANQYGVDRRELAAWNNLVNPNALRVGQVLILAAPGSGAAAPSPPVPSAPVTTPLITGGPPIEARPLGNSATAKVEPRGLKVPFSERALAQMMPADAGAPPINVAPNPPLETTPVPEPAKPAGTDADEVDWMWPAKGKVIAPFNETTKGMDIGGRKGAPVLAAAGGRVIYADQGLRGYGKLVIIRHNATWLSAYAHNDALLVKEQQEVRKGQKIAEMGSSDTDQVKLHFEVRRQGKPVDPAKYLPPM
jgi:lipoprotein NlpD